MKKIVLLCVIFLCTGCASNAPPSLSPSGAAIWQANEVVVALGMVQHAAIQLNGLQRCDASVCMPLVSDRNTGIVVDVVRGALLSIKEAPSGWRAVSLAALEQIRVRLDEQGRSRLIPYMTAVQQVIGGL